MADSYHRQACGTGNCLVADSVRDQFQPAWFDPQFWGQNATPVTAGGRGSAWFVASAAGELVLRHFCRGGLPGRFISRDYLYLGSDAVRSFAEFRLLHRLFRDGFPVPEPVAAEFHRQGLLFYQASIIIRRIPGAQPLSEFTSDTCTETWRDAGACVRRFHDAGVYHADLNCMNILVADQVYLIDFDRGRQMYGSSADNWKADNVSRLERSVKKLRGLKTGLRKTLWNAFLDGYRTDGGRPG